MAGFFNTPASKGPNQQPQVRDIAATTIAMSGRPEEQAIQFTGANPMTVARMRRGEDLLASSGTSGAAGEKKALLGG